MPDARKTGAKSAQNSTGDLGNIQVWNRISPHNFRMVALVVPRHVLGGVTGNLLPILARLLVQMQTQCPDFVKAWLLGSAPA